MYIENDLNDQCKVNTKEEMNENLKTYVWKENREKSERQINKKKLESCGNG